MTSRTARARLEATNSEDFVCTIDAADDDGEAYDLSDLVLTVTIRDQRKNVMDTLTLGSGLSFVTDGTDGAFTIFKSMTQYAPGMYDIGCTVATSSGSITRSLFVGQLSVVDGVV